MKFPAYKKICWTEVDYQSLLDHYNWTFIALKLEDLSAPT